MKKIFQNTRIYFQAFPRIVLFIAAVLVFMHISQAYSGEEQGVKTGGKVVDIRGSMSLDTIARESGVPSSYLIEALRLPKDIPLNLPLKELKDRYHFQVEDVRKIVTGYQTSEALTKSTSAPPAYDKGRGHAGEKKGGVNLPLVINGILCLVVLLLLRGEKLSNRLGIWILVPSLLIFGVLFRASAEPLRAIVQLFQSLALGMFDLRTTLVVFLAFFLMTFVGVKLVCGWGCPVGTLQELLFRLPVFNRLKKKRTPFWLSNSIRAVLFGIFLILAFGLIFGLKDQSLYRYFNPFRLFEWNFRVTAPIFVILIFGLSLFHYRPYCMFVCPFGLFSWLIQDLSIFKIRVNQDTCLDCGKCGQACPTGAAEGIIQEKTFKADCFSCARCLNACPKGSLKYRAF